MSEGFASVHRALSAWARRAESMGWLSESDTEALARIESQTADDLFAGTELRPLVVGLFGGTGAGKSSLLNRLAGERLARVGVERPTSREVTLYVHEDFPVTRLPEEFPREQTRLAYHRDPRRRLVAWLDMPDIDSTETTNRALALAWLPYVDWLIYVVSPERYGDDAGWQVLKARGHRHAWLFVMNRSDEGTADQVDDFRHRLVEAGFADPTVLATQCVEPARSDDFGRLEAEINAAIERHGLSELQRVNMAARRVDLYRTALSYRERFSDSRWEGFSSAYRRAVREGLQGWSKLLHWPLELTAQKFGAQDAPRTWFGKLWGTAHEKPVPVNEALLAGLWTTVAGNHLVDLGSRLQVEAANHQIPPLVVHGRVTRLAEQARAILTREAEHRLVPAVAQPGSAVRRFLYRLASAFTYLLPLGAVAWAGAHVVTRFYDATQGSEAFLGFSFLAHTLVLVGLAWLFAWLLKRGLRPSLVASVRDALHAALAVAVAGSTDLLEAVLTELDEERRQLRSALNSVLDSIGETEVVNLRGLVLPEPESDRPPEVNGTSPPSARAGNSVLRRGG